MTTASGGSILIDLSNLHVGGGVQVGAAFLSDLLDGGSVQRRPWFNRLSVEVSSEIAATIRTDQTSIPLRIVDRRPVGMLFRNWLSRPPDVEFVLFGPNYALRAGRMQMVGFADGTSLSPEICPPVGRIAAVKALLRRKVSRWTFRRASHIVVEAAATRDLLVARWRVSSDRISVIPNVLNPAFVLTMPSLAKIRPRPADADIVAIYPARNYPHKNLRILGAVADSLLARNGVVVKFMLTLTPAEWDELPRDVWNCSVNAGPQSIEDLKALYLSADVCTFVSLNESFSITPLEAISAGIPLVASDREFVRNVAGEAAIYCDPLCAESVADAIMKLLDNPTDVAERVALGRAIAEGWPTSAQRTESYLNAIERLIGAQ